VNDIFDPADCLLQSMETRATLLMWVFASALLLGQSNAFCFKNHLENKAIEVWVCTNDN
jgi:hypothetical protein